MKRLVQRFIVWGLERIDTLLDYLPSHWDGAWVGRSLGCRLGLAEKSVRLDDRWHTGVWK